MDITSIFSPRQREASSQIFVKVIIGNCFRFFQNLSLSAHFTIDAFYTKKITMHCSKSKRAIAGGKLYSNWAERGTLPATFVNPAQGKMERCTKIVRQINLVADDKKLIFPKRSRSTASWLVRVRRPISSVLSLCVTNLCYALNSYAKLHRTSFSNVRRTLCNFE